MTSKIEILQNSCKISTVWKSIQQTFRYCNSHQK